MSNSLRFDVFISAVTSEFEKARSGVASDLRARGLSVKVQEDFRQEAGADTTLQKIHEYIHNCAAVVCIIGARCGAVPPEAATKPFQHMLPNGLERASYTQWELIFARHYRKRYSRYYASPGYIAERDEPSDTISSELQRRFVVYLFEELGVDRKEFSNADQLRRMVLVEDWPKATESDVTQKPVSLPFRSLGTLFRGRGPFLSQLREKLHSGMDGSSLSPHVIGRVLHGLGGVGKTRLAIEFALQNQEAFSAVLFVTADSPENLQNNIAGLTGPLVLNLPEQNDVKNEEVRLAAAIRWLREHPGWFLILDNVDSEEAAVAVEALLAKLSNGQVLITSRLTNWSSGVESLALDVLDTPVSAAFLLERTASSGPTTPGRKMLPDDDESAKKLASELGGLALALEQAGAYICAKGISLSEYLKSWRGHQRRVLEWHNERLMQYPHSVAVTWQTTIEQLNPADITLLRLIAWYASDPIPLNIFSEPQSEAVWSDAVRCMHSESAASSRSSEIDYVDDSLVTLANYSMVQWNRENETVSIHKVVQDILRTRIPESAVTTWLTLSLRLLDAVAPAEPEDVLTWPIWNTIQAHVASAVEHAAAYDIAIPTDRLVSALGVLFSTRALYVQAEPLMRRGIELRERLLAFDDVGLVKPLTDYASMLSTMHRLSDADTLASQALSIAERSYSPTQIELAPVKHCLAEIRRFQARFSESLPLYEHALQIWQTALGSDDLLVATCLHHIGEWHHDQGNRTEAMVFYNRALVIREKSLPPIHPDIAVCLNDIGVAHDENGSHSDALPFYQRAFEMFEKSFGPNHKEVAAALHNLARIQNLQDNPALALPLFHQALEILERTFSVDHPNVKRCRDNQQAAIHHLLRQGIHTAGNLKVLLEVESQLDRDLRSEMAASLEAAAWNRLQAKDDGLAIECALAAVSIREQTDGVDHPNTAAALNTHVRCLQESGAYAIALPLCRRALAIWEQTPSDLANLNVGLNNLGLLLVCLEQYEEAKAHLDRAVLSDPANPYPIYWLAKLYQRRNESGDPAFELEKWQRYLELGPTTEARKAEALERINSLSVESSP